MDPVLTSYHTATRIAVHLWRVAWASKLGVSVDGTHTPLSTNEPGVRRNPKNFSYNNNFLAQSIISHYLSS